MSDFKVGDKVRCVNNAEGYDNSLVLGRVYTVTEVEGSCIQVDNWLRPYARRFVLVSSPPKDETPTHYKSFPVDVLTYAAANGMNFNIGNIWKYTLRAGKKEGNAPLEDLEKALDYLKKEIEAVKRRQRVAQGEDPFKVWGEKL